MQTYVKLLLAIGLVCSGIAVADVPVKEDIPKHPDELEFPALEYELPPAAQFRHVLANGLTVYIA